MTDQESENSFREEINKESERKYFTSYPKTNLYLTKMVGFFKKLRDNVSEFMFKKKESFKINYPQSFEKASNVVNNVKIRASDVKIRASESFGNLTEWIHERIKHDPRVHVREVSPESQETIWGSDRDTDTDRNLDSVGSVGSNKSQDIVVIVRDFDKKPLGNEEVVHIGDTEGISELGYGEFEC